MKMKMNTSKSIKHVDVKALFRKYDAQFGITIIFLATWLVFFILNPSGFSNPYTYRALMQVAPYTILPALTLTYVMIAKEVDLSFSAIMALGALGLAYTWKSGVPFIVGVFVGIGLGIVAGILNGVLIAKLKVPSLIATVGTMFFWRGVVLVVTQGFSTSLAGHTIFYSVFSGSIGGWIPVQMVWAVVLMAVLWLFLNRHRFGAYVYYVGDNRVAAKMVGIDVDGTLIRTFAIHGGMAAFAGILIGLSMRSFWPGLGSIYMLKSIAAVVIGGTPFTGGVGTIYGTFIGGLLLDLIETGILASGVSGFWIKVVDGLIILIALVAQQFFRRRR